MTEVSNILPSKSKLPWSPAFSAHLWHYLQTVL